ncbi:tyrosine-type recombinase/integrase [Chloroflexota bacterium]
MEVLQRFADKDTGNSMTQSKALTQFLESRREGISPGTIIFYRKYLSKALPYLGLTPSAKKINRFLDSLHCSIGGKHAYYRALSVFYNWLYVKSELGFKPQNNPLALVEAPKRPKLILPSLTKEQIEKLFESVHSPRDKATIALFIESGLRVSELANIRTEDINWGHRTIKVLCKGGKKGYAPFGSFTERYLMAWLADYSPKHNEYIWDIKRRGIQQVMETLREETGLPCNPHTFRRTFACLLRKAGVDSLTIKDLGRWESIEMVQRYTRSVTFHDALKYYKAPLG